MIGDLDPGMDEHQKLRARRLVQISSMVLVALLLAISVYLYLLRPGVVTALLSGFVLVALSRWLSRRGRTELASTLLLSGMFGTIAALMWISNGLKDASILGLPAILVMAGLLAQRALFFGLLAAMVAYVTALQLATAVWGWRPWDVADSPWHLWLDVVVILLLSGMAVWIIVNDLHRVLASLRVQIGRFHESEKHLTYLSQHDPLTGLSNRTLGRDRIGQAIVRAARSHTRVAMLFVDLDNFKAINDSLGHNVGDEFLKQVALRLQQAVRQSDIVVRHGGDEFIVGLTDVKDAQDMSGIVRGVMDKLAVTFAAHDAEIATSCSIGIAIYPDDGPDYETLLRLSDIAMYQAKDAGRNAFRFYDAAMNAVIEQSLLLVSELRQAMSRKEFVLHFQPVFSLDTGALLGAEALVRWQHPERGLVPPGLFIPAAEKSGLICELGAWVLAAACRQMKLWQPMLGRDCFMAVNLSPVQFRRGDIDAVVQSALQESGLSPEHLELEITESTLVQDSEKFMLTLQRLKALGVKLSIDDFGTGYSNLSYLQRFAVDKLKVDQSFVRQLQRSAQDRALVNAIIQMAKSLNLHTTAEGIEDDIVRQELVALGCDQGQGYFYARPLPPAEFEVFLRVRQQT